MVYRQKGSVRKTYQTAGETLVVLPTSCPPQCRVFSMYMYLLERKSKTLYSQGLGTMVTNDWCINGEAIIKQGSHSINDISLFHTILNDQFKKKTFKMGHTLYYK